LTNWLIDNLSAKKINFKVKKISTDETDIEIVKHGGDTYLIEIKWLGKNEGNTEYDENRVAAAFDQIKNYLDVDKDVLEVTLVVYDGRKAEEFNKFSCIRSEDGNWKEINECKARKMPLKGTGFLFLLISETASIRKAD
jgi:hypothetical protein